MQNTILDTEVTTIDGEVTSLQPYSGNVLLIVNVASKCGLTPQYEQLENLQKAWHQQGFTVLGFPCNQFLGQEPGSEEEIKTYCSTTWGVTFPMFSKIEVNGEGRHPLYQKLIDAGGELRTADDDVAFAVIDVHVACFTLEDGKRGIGKRCVQRAFRR